ncbi:glycosyltransferase, partial [Bradyrhizobium sp. NBAIM08]|uniref:glycosyltransferase n=1 Tax=Bradyrhizobium sp. NBAIM08 TaxID=2793815 RepID=UPI001CD206AF
LEIGAEHVALDIGRKSPLALRHVRALRALFREVDTDIVHARSRLPAWLGWWAVRGMRPPASRPHVVTTAHGLNSPSRYSAIMARSERVICVSRTVREYLLARYPATDPDRLVVIPRGIDPEAFARVPRVDREARARIADVHPQLAGDG